MRHYGGGIGHFKNSIPAQQVESLPEDEEDEQENTEGDIARDQPTQDVSMHNGEVGSDVDEDDSDSDSTDPENYDYSKDNDDDDDDDEGSSSSSDSDEEDSSSCASS